MSENHTCNYEHCGRTFRTTQGLRTHIRAMHFKGTIEETVDRAIRADEAADRAFKRWFFREVSSSSGAAALKAKAEEAWADVRFHPDFDEGKHGEFAIYNPFGTRRRED